MVRYLEPSNASITSVTDRQTDRRTDGQTNAMMAVWITLHATMGG